MAEMCSLSLNVGSYLKCLNDAGPLLLLLFMVVEFQQRAFHNISVILSQCFDIFGGVFAFLTFFFVVVDNGRSTIENGGAI